MSKINLTIRSGICQPKISDTITLQCFSALYSDYTTQKQKIAANQKGSQRYGADDEARTRYLHLGKVALYRMSYIRNCKRNYIKHTCVCQVKKQIFSELFQNKECDNGKYVHIYKKDKSRTTEKTPKCRTLRRWNTCDYLPLEIISRLCKAEEPRDVRA